ncbi:MAG: phosphoglucomutase [Paenibacillus sp. RIFOXYA1_FULL_44_5]|nr:MAG: phosphoglucomutase [Paenibacillus sp. RIFOXYA1_FULL_44_5]
MELSNRAREQYEAWLLDQMIDDQTRQELQQLEGNTAEIEDRFYKDLQFGTGGLRGVIGAGTNRMNEYTVGRATQGLAQYILQSGEQPHSMVIAYDSRHRSREFAVETALVMAGNGILAYVFESLRPTPELSFAVRHLQASAGVVVTASHNPPEYNGYKVYGSDGCQLVPDMAEQVIAEIAGVSSFSQVRKLSREEAEKEQLLIWIGEAVDEAFIQEVVSVSRNPQIIQEMNEQFKVVYTPLHGAGFMPVNQVLLRAGFTHVLGVAEQNSPDPNFSTVKSPNPEEKEAFTLAIELAKKENADLIIGTDPDCDRMGAVVKDANGEYTVLSGNQAGAIMTNYLLSSMKERGELPENGALIKTIVTSEMGAEIAKSFGVHIFNTLTGFKYIGEKMTQFEQNGDYVFLFGYEESYGYLAGSYARDKDAVVASLLISEAAAYYKHQGKTLPDVLDSLYQQYGYFQESLVSRTLKGKDGVATIQNIMKHWRENAPQAVGDMKIAEMKDYEPGIDGLPPENVLKYVLDDGSWFCLRPSGTEPKIKIYFAVQGADKKTAVKKMQQLAETVMAVVDGVIHIN